MTFIVSAGYNNSMKIWNSETGECINDLIGHTSSINLVSFSPDSSRIFSGSYDGTVRIWDFNTCELINILTDHFDCVNSVCFSDGIVSGSYF